MGSCQRTRQGRNTNSYKFALWRALANLAANTDERNPKVSKRDLAVLFVSYYWPLEVKYRAEDGLPLLSIPRELRRMKMVEDAMAFEQFADRHRESVWEEVLAPVREARGEPTWRPTGFMEGMGFQAQVSKVLRERFKVAQTSPNKSG
jgi:hypothetical protein